MKVDKSKWGKKKLEEVCVFFAGYTPSSIEISNKGEVPYFKVAEMNLPGNEKYLSNTTLFLVPSRKTFPKYSIVFPKNGAAITTNKKRILLQTSVVDLNTEGIIVNNEILYTFMYNFFLQLDFNKHIRRGAIPTLNLKEIKELVVPVPPLLEQQAIASELDAIQSLITKYKEQLNDYDNLAKSIFNEMFGDVVSNDRGWERKKLPEITLNRDNERKPVSSVMREKLDKIYDYYGACGVIDKIETYIFDGDFLLIGEDGANLLTVVKPNAIIAKGKFWVNNHAHILQCKCNVDILYLCYCFNCIPLKPYITGVAQPKLNQANLNKILISLPPLPLQQTFAARITAIESQKDQVKQQITDLQTLFDSRMQYYFD